jgi:hypothetical protein
MAGGWVYFMTNQRNGVLHRRPAEGVVARRGARATRLQEQSSKAKLSLPPPQP